VVALPADRAVEASALPRGRRERATRFLALWVALVLVPLSLSRGKIDYYLLPLYPAVSLVVGRYLAAVPWKKADRAWAGVVLLLEAAGLALVLLRPPGSRRVASRPRAPGLLAVLLAAGTLALLAVAARPTAARASAALASLVAAAWLVLVVFYLPAFAAAQPNRAIVADVARERQHRPDLRWPSARTHPRPARRAPARAARRPVGVRLWSLAGSREPFLLLATPPRTRPSARTGANREIARYRYVPASALTLGGLFSLREPGEIVLGATSRRATPWPRSSASASTARRSRRPGGPRRGRSRRRSRSPQTGAVTIRPEVRCWLRGRQARRKVARCRLVQTV